MTTNKSMQILKLFCALVLLFGTSAGQEFKSFKRFEEAKKEALSTHKLIFVTFEMDATETINRIRSDNNPPTGIQYSKITGAPCMYFIPPMGLSLNCVLCTVPYDAESSLRNKYYSEDKTALVLDAFGNELYAEICKGREKLIRILQSLPKDASNYYLLLKNLQEHPDSLKLKMALADLCQLYQATTASRRYYNEIAKSQEYKSDSTLSDHVQSHLALNAFLDNDYDEAEDLFSDHIKNYPHSSERPMQLFLLTKISIIKKDKDEATRYWQVLQSEFPNDQHTVWAKNLLDQYKE